MNQENKQSVGVCDERFLFVLGQERDCNIHHEPVSI